MKHIERWPLTTLFLLILGVTVVMGGLIGAMLWKLGPVWTAAVFVLAGLYASVEADRRGQRRRARHGDRGR